MKIIKLAFLEAKYRDLISKMRGKTFYRITSLHWADILVLYALFVMQNYLTEVWNLSMNHAAAILNIWNGMYRILPVFILFLVDSFLGHFKLLLITTISFCIGTVFVFMSLPPILAESTHTCKAYESHCVGNTQVGLLYAGLVLIAVGLAGNHVSVDKFRREQINQNLGGLDGNQVSVDRFLDEQRELTNRNPGADLIVVIIVGAFGKLIPFIRPWTLRFGIPAVFSILVTLSFITGFRSYHKEPPNPNGSPLCNVCRVFVAAARKMFRPYPDDNQRYHGSNEEEFSSTCCLIRVLHKAAIIEENGVSNRWNICSVAEVEDAKFIVGMVPLWMTLIVCGIISSTGDTYFVQQSGTLDRHIGKLKLPVEVFLLVKMVFSYVPKIYENENIVNFIKIFAPFTWFAINMVLSVLCCIAAAGIERMRLKVVRRDGLLDKADEDVQMSVFWLLFQFYLLAPVEAMPSSMNSYYSFHAPESLEAYLQSFSRAMYGLGFMCSSLFVYVVGRISEIGGRPNWFQETLNKSRLDRYYWVLAGLSTVNFVMLYVVNWYYIPPELGQGGLEARGANAENPNGEGGSHPAENDVELGSGNEGGGSHPAENDVEMGSGTKAGGSHAVKNMEMRPRKKDLNPEKQVNEIKN